ncbi:MAG: PH domain-containing protein [Eggerthellaceae bacterium]|jgi:putative membrane protein
MDREQATSIPQSEASDGQAAEPASSGTRYTSTFHTGQAYRVHHSYVWLMPLNTMIVIAFAILAGMGQSLLEIYQELAAQGVRMAAVPFIVLVVLVVMAVSYGLSAGYHAWAYRHLWYEFDEREFSVYSGIFNKRRVHVPYARVQSVNHKAGILQRIFGVCTVTVDTAGGSANKEVSIPYVELGVGERIRAELFMRKAALMTNGVVELVYRDPDASGERAPGAPSAPVPPSATVENAASSAPVPPASHAGNIPASASATEANTLDQVTADVIDWRGAFGGAHAGMEPVAYEFGLSNGELFLASASHSAAISLLVAFTILDVCSAMLFGALSAFMIPLMIVIAVIAWLVGMVPVLLSYGGFKARRRGSRIEVERGLLQRQFSGIDVDRIQSVVVRQSVVRHFFGFCEVSLGRIDAASQDESEGQSQLNPQGLVIHPFVRLDKVDELLSGLLPEFDGRPQSTQQQRVAPVALRRGIIRRCIWQNPALYIAAGLVVLQLIFSWYIAPDLGSAFSHSRALIVQQGVSRAFLIGYILCAAATAIIAVGTVVWWRESGISFNRAFVRIFNSGLATESVTVPRVKVQSGATRTNPLQRLAHTATVSLVTAAGIGQTKTRLIDVGDDCAESWLSWLEPRQSASSSSQHL